jgi:hypothetical protein
MESEISIRIGAPSLTVFQIASRVEHWPQILPHYRFVNLLAGDERLRIVEMGAQRDGFPVHWTSIQEILPEKGRVRFKHIGGATRGMNVEWRIESSGDETTATIWHQFNPGLLRGGPVFGKLIVGDIFVHNIASKTLRCIKQVAESLVLHGGPYQ